MSRLLERKIRDKELKFRAISNSNPAQEQRRACPYCGRLVYYSTVSGQLVEYCYAIKQGVIGAPGIQIVKKVTQHVCQANCRPKI